MSNILKNKKIIISAGASGIGWATAKVCLSKGATVFISDIEKKFLNKEQIDRDERLLKNYYLNQTHKWKDPLNFAHPNFLILLYNFFPKFFSLIHIPLTFTVAR